MDDPKALNLFRELLLKSTEGKIPWEATADDEIFIAPIKGKYVFEIRSYEYLDNWGNRMGDPIILFKDGDRELLTMSSDITGIDSGALKQVYQIAKRLALNIDQNIDEALNDIKEL
jgi:hypothetical protein